MARSLAILVAVLALGAVGAAVAVAMYALDRQPVTVRADSSEASGSEALELQILATLERIEAALARLESRPVRPAGAAAARPLESRGERPDGIRSELSTESEENERLAGLLAEVRAVLDEHVAAERAWRDATQSLGELKASSDGADWKALDALLDQWHRDEAQAKKAAQLMTFRDVLMRYGTPTEIWRDDDGAHWVYQRGVDEVYLRFNDGFVTVLGVK